MNEESLKTLNILLREAFEEPTGLDSDKLLSWIFDDVNTKIYDYKVMDTYSVTFKVYGYVSDTDNKAWGTRVTEEMSKDALDELLMDPNVQVLSSEVVSPNDQYRALIAKITPDGKRVNAKSYKYYKKR